MPGLGSIGGRLRPRDRVSKPFLETVAELLRFVRSVAFSGCECQGAKGREACFSCDAKKLLRRLNLQKKQPLPPSGAANEALRVRPATWTSVLKRLERESRSKERRKWDTWKWLRAQPTKKLVARERFMRDVVAGHKMNCPSCADDPSDCTRLSEIEGKLSRIRSVVKEKLSA